MTYRISEESLNITGLISQERLEAEVLNALSTMTNMRVLGLTSTIIYSIASPVESVEIHFKLLLDGKE